MAQTRDAPPTGRMEDIMGLSLILYDGTHHTETLLLIPYGVCLTPYQAGKKYIFFPLRADLHRPYL